MGLQVLSYELIKNLNSIEKINRILAIAKKDHNEVEIRVHPVLITSNKMIAKIDGVNNGVSVIGDKVGETLYYGAGAGGDATASAVIANLIDIARAGKSSPMLGYKKPLEGKLQLKKIDDIVSKYYLRIKVEDKSGVLAKIANILGKNKISIKTMLQKNANKYANLLLSTHMAKEVDIQRAKTEIDNLEFVYSKTILIRIED